MMKRPKDMTTVELESLPELVMAEWPGLGDDVRPDDIAIWMDRTGRRFRFVQRDDGKWFKVPVSIVDNRTRASGR